MKLTNCFTAGKKDLSIILISMFLVSTLSELREHLYDVSSSELDSDKGRKSAHALIDHEAVRVVEKAPWDSHLSLAATLGGNHSSAPATTVVKFDTDELLSGQPVTAARSFSTPPPSAPSSVTTSSPPPHRPFRICKLPSPAATPVAASGPFF